MCPVFLTLYPERRKEEENISKKGALSITSTGTIHTSVQDQTTLEIRLANVILDCDKKDPAAAAPLPGRYVSVRRSAHTVNVPRDEEVRPHHSGMWPALTVTTALLTVLTVLSQII